MLWMGETSGAGGATHGADLVKGRFLGVFWLADKLGIAAATGHSVVCKQQYRPLYISLRTVSLSNRELTRCATLVY